MDRDRAGMRIIGAIAVLGLLAGCSGRLPTAVGDRNQIVVLADTDTWEAWGPALQRVFEREVETPRREYVFTLRQVAPDSWDFFQRYKNLVLCASLASPGPVAERIRTLMSPEARSRVEQGGRAVQVTLRDPYASGQLLLVITADTDEHLAAYLDSSGNGLFDVMEEELNDRVRDGLYEFEERYALEDTLFTSWDFLVRVPYDFRLNATRAGEHFVRMIKYVPERWFFAWWVPEEDLEGEGVTWVRDVLPRLGAAMDGGTDPTPEEMGRLAADAMDLRDRIGRRFYDGDSVVREDTRATLVQVDGRWAIRLYGLWENNTRFVGGPLVTYLFWDPSTRRVWWLDGAVFAPNAAKENWLRQMDVMLKTFRSGAAARDYLDTIQDQIRDDR